MSCENDFDCEGAELCYVNVSWSDEDSFCACSSWYGGAGSDCSEHTIESYSFIAAATLFLIVGVFFLNVALYYEVFGAFVKNKLFAFDASTTTWLFSVIGLFGICFNLAVELNAAANPEKNDNKGVYDEQKVSPLNNGARIMGFIGIAGAALSGMNITLMWIEIAERVDKMSKEYYTNLKRYRKIVYATQAFWLILAISLLFVESPAIVGVVGYPVMLLVLLLILYGRKRLVATLRQALELSESETANSPAKARVTRMFRNAIKRVNTLAWRLSLTLSITLVLALSYIVLYGFFDWKDLSPRGRVNYIVLLMVGATGMLNFFNGFTYLHAHQAIQDKVKALSSAKVNILDETKSKDNATYSY